MTKKSKILVATSVLAMAGVAGIAVGTTTALFTDQGKTSVHINAGKLDVGFYVTSMVRDEITSTGAISKDVAVDLSSVEPYKDYYNADVGGVDLKEFDGNVFSITEAYPTMQGAVTFFVKNNSNISVNVHVEETDKGYFVDGTAETEMSSEELALFGITSSWNGDTEIAAGGETSFTISFSISEDAGNEYQNSRVEIDPVITATQIVRS